MTRPVGSGPGSAVRKRIASGCWNLGRATSSGTGSPSANRSATSTRSTPVACRTRSAIWPPGIRAATSTTATEPSGWAISCGKAIPSREPEHLDGARGDALRELELVAVGRRRVDVDPADAEADPGWPQPVRERHDLGRAAARDHDPVHLDAVDEALEDALLLRRLGERRVEVAVEVVRALDPEDAALAARVGRLEHRRQPDRPQRPPALAERANGGERRLRHAFLGEGAPHHDLVAHPLGDGGADRRQAEPLRHRRDDRDGAVGRDRQRAVDGVPARDLRHRVDVGEVDRLCDVGDLEPERVGVAVDRDDADALLARLQDRAALVAPGADEEDGLHTAAMLLDDPREVTAATAAGRGTRRASSARSRSRRRWLSLRPDARGRRSVPVTSAVVGPPEIWVQTRPRGVGANAPAPDRAQSGRQAAPGRRRFRAPGRSGASGPAAARSSVAR